MRFLFILTLLFPLLTFASDCSEVNLITRKDSPFKKIPVYDQDGLSACYAYAAAQLVDYELIKRGGKRQVHPLWVALKYSQRTGQSKVSSGEVDVAINQLRRQGNCHRDNISKALSVWTKEANVKEVELVAFIEKLIPKMNALSKSGLWSLVPYSFALSDNEINQVFDQAIKEMQPFCSQRTNFEKLIPQLKEITRMTSREVISALILPECKETSDLNIPKTVTFTSTENEEYSEQLKNKLNTLNAPVSISYCSKVLKDPKYDGISRWTLSILNQYDSQCGAHESLIVGKKLLNGQCHFLLRNSWGAGFGSQTKNWKCLCKNKKTGKFLDNCERSKHNNGSYTVEGCWISQTAISKNTFGITNLSSK